MKRISSLSLILCCILFCFAACSESSPPELSVAPPASSGSHKVTGSVPETSLPISASSGSGSFSPAPTVPSLVSSSEHKEEDECTVIMKDSAGVRYRGDVSSNVSIKKGTTITFTLEVSSLYVGTPVVKANGEIIKKTGEEYTVTVLSDTVIEVSGLTLKAPSLSGTGTLDDPFVITEPVDLLYIAQQVNKGNTVYNSAYYCLDSDLNFDGEKMEVIGDGSGEYSYFEGYFDGQGHTISNFVLDTVNTTYVGMFGIMQANIRDSISATVYNLSLKDYTVLVNASGGSVFCGSFAGYGLGASLILCNAENGNIELHGNINDFSYLGGLIGFQQGLSYNGRTFLCGVAYCSASVNVTCLEGMAYCAGGITGYLSATDKVTAYINNCFSTGNVEGALISGGIVGYMGSDTTVLNCYATGVVGAQTYVSDAENSERYCHAYAGGISGVAEPDCVIAESFATGKIYGKAQLGNSYEHIGGILGEASSIQDGSFADYPATVYNCCYVKDGKDGNTVIDREYIRDVLHWNDWDWIYENDSYPTINTNEVEDASFDITIKFPGAEDLFITGFETYLPMRFWYLENVLPTPTGFTYGEGSTYTAYGFFFDEDYIFPIPDGYIPTHDFVIYVAVADYAEVAGEYIIANSTADNPAYLILNIDGSFSYSDGGEMRNSYYRYDGKKLVFRDTRFGEYSSDIALSEKYLFSDFSGTLSDGKLKIIGGEVTVDDESVSVFTEQSPLWAIDSSKLVVGSFYCDDLLYMFEPNYRGMRYENGIVTDFVYEIDGTRLTVTLDNGTVEIGTFENGDLTISEKAFSSCDEYRGTWHINSKAHKIFSFDGAGNWSYIYFGYEKNMIGIPNGANKVIFDRKAGKYTVDPDGGLTLSGGITGKAWFENGALKISTSDGEYVCSREGSHYGVWVYPEYGMTLKLNGILKNGKGSARVEYKYDNEAVEFYDLTYSTDHLSNGVTCLYYGRDLFGCVYYSQGTDTLNAMIYVGPLNAYMQNIPLYGVDDLTGCWISEKEGMTVLEFNGYGSYQIDSDVLTGSVSVEGQNVQYKLHESTLSGSLVYNDRLYFISYDESRTALVLSSENDKVEFVRKDAFGALVLTDENGNEYCFDGRGALSSQGTMTVTDLSGALSEYRYEIVEGGLNIILNGQRVGTVSLDEANKAYLYKAEKETFLKIKTSFTGEWALSGSPEETLLIGAMGTDGKYSGRINGRNTVFSQNEDGNLSFTFDGATYYIIPVGEKNIVICSSVIWYQSDDVLYGAPVDDMIGSWKNSLGAVFTFDGMSQGTLTGGTAETELGGNKIHYYYTFDQYGQYILWTSEGGTGDTAISRLVFCDVTARRAYIKGDRAFTVESGDRLYGSTFVSVEDGRAFTFDGFGKVQTDDGQWYAYQVLSLDSSIGKASVLIEMDGESKTAYLDFSNSLQFTLTFEK